MTPWLQDPDITLYHGDNLDVLRTLPDKSVHMCATSPPFFGLRDYGTGTWEGGDPDCDHGEERRSRRNAESQPGSGSGAGGTTALRDGPPPTECPCGARRVDRQIGLEETPDQWVQNLVRVFREVRRVLRDDGTLWVEIGDSYTSVGGGPPGGDIQNGNIGSHALDRIRRPGKAKDLVGQPWLLAFALRADGWWLRSEIIWARPNPMPESVTDRPTKSHSTVFLLSKQPRYFYDADAIREPSIGRAVFGNSGHKATQNGDRQDGDRNDMTPNEGANARSVWTIDYTEGEEVEWAGKIGFCRACNGLRIAGIGSEDLTAKATDASSATTENAAPTESDTNSGSAPSGTASPSTTSARTSGASTLPTSNPSPSGSTSSEATPSQPATLPRPTASTGTSSPQRTLIDALTAAGNAVCVCETERGGDGHARSVWKVATQPTPFAHFATWPEALCRRMILAGSPEGGVVLDPFAGSGTTCLVSRNHQRHSIGIELNEEYLKIAAKRLQQLSLLTGVE